MRSEGMPNISKGVVRRSKGMPNLSKGVVRRSEGMPIKGIKETKSFITNNPQ